MTAIDRDRGLAAAVPTADGSDPSTAAPAAEPLPVDAAGRGRRPGRIRTWLVAIAGALVLPVVVAAGLTWTAASTDVFAPKVADARVVSAADLEQEFGIKVNLVAVIADGGLVDVRFTVLDKEKAAHVLHDADTLPALLVESNGAVLRAPRPHAHKLTLVDGASYFLLFPNSGGVVQSGTPVSVVISDIRLAPLDAQS
jgi:hypothetical protein